MSSITHTILEQLDTLFVVVNPQGELEYVSPYARRLLGFEISHLLGNGWWNRTRPGEEDRIANKAFVLSLINSNMSAPVTYERSMISANGETKWVLWNISKQPDNRLVGVGYDITARKLLEEDLLKKNKELLTKNSEVSESIQYARRIQEAVLQDRSGLEKYFPGAFIYYSPKDVVSGDFYWYHATDERIFVAAIDCTGHGVPGALMSVMASGLIRQSVVMKGLSDPAEILSSMDADLVKALSREDGSLSASDGMDVSLAVINRQDRSIEFSGAFRPLVVLSDGKITELKGSRFPLGSYLGLKKKFETERIFLKEKDRVYLFSDGYADQFGGEKGKKMNKKRFYEMLQVTFDMEMGEQESYLDYALRNWKQDEPQTDDVLVVGIELG